MVVCVDFQNVCERINQHAANASSEASMYAGRCTAGPVAQLREWLAARHDIPDDVELHHGGYAPSRTRLPKGRYNRMLITELLICTLKMALAGNSAADVLVASFPRVMMRKGCSFKVALAVLMKQANAPELKAKPIVTKEARFARALQNACVDRQTYGIYRALDRYAAPLPDDNVEAVRTIAAELFPRNIEHETPTEEIEYARQRGLHEESAGDAAVPIKAADVRAWAFKKSRRAADLYGWSGRLILDFIAVRPEVGHLLAKYISRAPRAMKSASAASTLWREAKGSIIPKAGKTGAYRPIAIGSFARRIWAAKATRCVRMAASRYCEVRGQLGLSCAGSTVAYATIARWALQSGGTVCTDDKRNSFGSLGRCYVIDAVSAFLDDRTTDIDHDKRRIVEAIMDRLFISQPLAGVNEEGEWKRTSHIYPFANNESHDDYALTQGSSLSPPCLRR